MVSLTDSKATDEYGSQRMSERIKAINSNMTPFAFFRQFLILFTDYYGSSKKQDEICRVSHSAELLPATLSHHLL